MKRFLSILLLLCSFVGFSDDSDLSTLIGFASSISSSAQSVQSSCDLIRSQLDSISSSSGSYSSEITSCRDSLRNLDLSLSSLISSLSSYFADCLSYYSGLSDNVTSLRNTSDALMVQLSQVVSSLTALETTVANDLPLISIEVQSIRQLLTSQSTVLSSISQCSQTLLSKTSSFVDSLFPTYSASVNQGFSDILDRLENFSINVSGGSISLSADSMQAFQNVYATFTAKLDDLASYMSIVSSHVPTMANDVQIIRDHWDDFYLWSDSWNSKWMEDRFTIRLNTADWKNPGYHPYYNLFPDQQHNRLGYLDFDHVDQIQANGWFDLMVQFSQLEHKQRESIHHTISKLLYSVLTISNQFQTGSISNVSNVASNSLPSTNAVFSPPSVPSISEYESYTGFSSLIPSESLYSVLSIPQLPDLTGEYSETIHFDTPSFSFGSVNIPSVPFVVPVNRDFCENCRSFFGFVWWSLLVIVVFLFSRLIIFLVLRIFGFVTALSPA